MKHVNQQFRLSQKSNFKKSNTNFEAIGLNFDCTDESNRKIEIHWYIFLAVFKVHIFVNKCMKKWNSVLLIDYKIIVQNYTNFCKNSNWNRKNIQSKIFFLIKNFARHWKFKPFNLLKNTKLRAWSQCLKASNKILLNETWNTSNRKFNFIRPSFFWNKND